jgi:hypothetical protein
MFLTPVNPARRSPFGTLTAMTWLPCCLLQPTEAHFLLNTFKQSSLLAHNGEQRLRLHTPLMSTFKSSSALTFALRVMEKLGKTFKYRQANTSV